MKQGGKKKERSRAKRKGVREKRKKQRKKEGKNGSVWWGCEGNLLHSLAEGKV